VLPEAERASAHVFFSAHGLPQKYIDELGEYMHMDRAGVKLGLG